MCFCKIQISIARLLYILRLIYIVNTIFSNLDTKEDSCLVFLDQSKAFDYIHHKSLKYKMQTKGIAEKLLQLMGSYLHNRKLRLVLDGAKSMWLDVLTGVPQGSILGSLLFLVYVDDLVDDLKCDVHLYTDEAVLTKRSG